jgi:hypothetical protein
VEVSKVCEKYPYDRRPKLSADQKPQRANTMASFERKMNALMNPEDEEKKMETESVASSTAAAEQTYVYAVFPSAQDAAYSANMEQLLVSAPEHMETLSADFAMNQRLNSVPTTTEYQAIYSMMPQTSEALRSISQ